MGADLFGWAALVTGLSGLAFMLCAFMTYRAGRREIRRTEQEARETDKVWPTPEQVEHIRRHGTWRQYRELPSRVKVLRLGAPTNNESWRDLTISEGWAWLTRPSVRAAIRKGAAVPEYPPALRTSSWPSHLAVGGASGGAYFLANQGLDWSSGAAFLLALTVAGFLGQVRINARRLRAAHTAHQVVSGSTVGGGAAQVSGVAGSVRIGPEGVRIGPEGVRIGPEGVRMVRLGDMRLTRMPDGRPALAAPTEEEQAVAAAREGRLAQLRIHAEAGLPFLDFDHGNIMTPAQVSAEIDRLEAETRAEMDGDPDRMDHRVEMLDAAVRSAAATRDEAQRVIADAVKAGRIHPRGATAWVAHHVDDPDGCRALLDALPVQTPAPGDSVRDVRPPTTDAERHRRWGDLVGTYERGGQMFEIRAHHHDPHAGHHRARRTHILVSTGEQVCPHLRPVREVCPSCVIDAGSPETAQILRAEYHRRVAEHRTGEGRDRHGHPISGPCPQDEVFIARIINGDQALPDTPQVMLPSGRTSPRFQLARLIEQARAVGHGPAPEQITAATEAVADAAQAEVVRIAHQVGDGHMTVAEAQAHLDRVAARLGLNPGTRR